MERERSSWLFSGTEENLVLLFCGGASTLLAAAALLRLRFFPTMAACFLARAASAFSFAFAAFSFAAACLAIFSFVFCFFISASIFACCNFRSCSFFFFNVLSLSSSARRICSMYERPFDVSENARRCGWR